MFQHMGYLQIRMKTKIIKGNCLSPPSKAEIEYLNYLIRTSAKSKDKWPFIAKIIKQNKYFYLRNDRCSLVLKVE